MSDEAFIEVPSLFEASEAEGIIAALKLEGVGCRAEKVITGMSRIRGHSVAYGLHVPSRCVKIVARVLSEIVFNGLDDDWRPDFCPCCGESVGDLDRCPSCDLSFLADADDDDPLVQFIRQNI